MIKRTHEEYVELLNKKFGYIIPLGKYVNSQNNLKHKCLKCGYIWNPTPNRLLQKTNRGCPKCSKKERNKEATKTTEQYRNELVQLQKSFTCIGEYLGANIKTLHKCIVCGYEFMATPHVILRSGVCENCSKEINSTLKHIELLKERRPDMEVLEDYKGKNVKILHRHCCGHEYKISPAHVLQTSGGCEYCYRIARRKSDEEFKSQMANSELKIIGTYEGANKKIEVMCPKGHIYKSYPSNLLKGFGCPLCVESGGESKIKKYLESHNIRFIQHISFDDLKDKNKLSYDFYLPDYNLLIEFQGKQHEKPLKYFGGEERFKYQKKHDQMKKDYAIKNGYNILYIWYYEQENIDNILDECLKSKSVETAG